MKKPLTLAQQKAIAICPHFSGFLSMVGSSCIIHSVRSEIKNGQATTYHRLLLGLSAFDIVASFGQSLATWPAPVGTPGIWGSFGNTATCTLQGLLVHSTGASPLYNAAIGVYFLLQARFGWSNERLRKIEPIMHGIPIINYIVTVVTALSLNLFNSAKLWCWVAPFPPGCKDSFRYGDEANCVRGDNAWFFSISLMFGQAYVSIVVTFLAMLLIFLTVLSHEKAVDKVQENGVVVRTQSKRVVMQALYYFVAFFIVWGPPSIIRVASYFPGNKIKVGFPLFLYGAIFAPCQGFLNAFAYFRAKFVKQRRDHPHEPLLNAMVNTVFSSTKTEVMITSTDEVFNKARKKPQEETVDRSQNETTKVVDLPASETNIASN